MHKTPVRFYEMGVIYNKLNVRVYNFRHYLRSGNNFLSPQYLYNLIVETYMSIKAVSKFNLLSIYLSTGKFTKRVREMSPKLFETQYTLSIYPYAHKQLRRHLQNPSRELP